MIVRDSLWLSRGSFRLFVFAERLILSFYCCQGCHYNLFCPGSHYHFLFLSRGGCYDFQFPSRGPLQFFFQGVTLIFNFLGGEGGSLWTFICTVVSPTERSCDFYFYSYVITVTAWSWIVAKNSHWERVLFLIAHTTYLGKRQQCVVFDYGVGVLVAVRLFNLNCHAAWFNAEFVP